jgi:ParB family chromosome partitioning protein
MAKKSGLGRGLDALIGGEEYSPPVGVEQVPVEIIKPNPMQPRNNMQVEQMEELAESIRQHGILQPLIVSRSGAAEEYVLIAGERRLEAARLAGLETVPVVTREASDQQRLELALIENLQRTDLGPLEAAEAFRQLAQDFGLSHEEIAARVGKSRTTVTNTMRLLNLEPEVQQAIADGVISEGHGRALLGLEGKQYQPVLLEKIIAEGLNVRQTEALVRKINQPGSARPKSPGRSAEVIALEGQISQSLNTRVNLLPKKKGGRLVIYYYSNEELNTILDRILPED